MGVFFSHRRTLLQPPEWLPLPFPCSPCPRRTSDDEVKAMFFVVVFVACGGVWFRAQFLCTYALLRLLLLLLVPLLPPPRCSRSWTTCLLCFLFAAGVVVLAPFALSILQVVCCVVCCVCRMLCVACYNRNAIVLMLFSAALLPFILFDKPHPLLLLYFAVAAVAPFDLTGHRKLRCVA